MPVPVEFDSHVRLNTVNVTKAATAVRNKMRRGSVHSNIRNKALFGRFAAPPTPKAGDRPDWKRPGTAPKLFGASAAVSQNASLGVIAANQPQFKSPGPAPTLKLLPTPTTPTPAPTPTSTATSTATSTPTPTQATPTPAASMVEPSANPNPPSGTDGGDVPAATDSTRPADVEAPAAPTPVGSDHNGVSPTANHKPQHALPPSTGTSAPAPAPSGTASADATTASRSGPETTSSSSPSSSSPAAVGLRPSPALGAIPPSHTPRRSGLASLPPEVAGAYLTRTASRLCFGPSRSSSSRKLAPTPSFKATHPVSATASQPLGPTSSAGSRGSGVDGVAATRSAPGPVHGHGGHGHPHGHGHHHGHHGHHHHHHHHSRVKPNKLNLVSRDLTPYSDAQPGLEKPHHLTKKHSKRSLVRKHSKRAAASSGAGHADKQSWQVKLSSKPKPHTATPSQKRTVPRKRKERAHHISRARPAR